MEIVEENTKTAPISESSPFIKFQVEATVLEDTVQNIEKVGGTNVEEPILVEQHLEDTNKKRLSEAARINFGTKNDVDNKEDSEEEDCKEIWCNEENEVVMKLDSMPTTISPNKIGSKPEGTQIAKLITNENGDAGLVSFSDKEDDGFLVMKGKDKAYESESEPILIIRSKKNGEDMVVRKSKQVHTRYQKLNL